MSKEEEKVRIFNCTDADMTQASRVMHGLFTGDKALFIKFDASLADPFGDNWLQKIELCGAVVQDKQYVDGITGMTKNIEHLMEDAKTLFQSAKYFIEKAFPHQKEIHNQLGYSSYGDVGRSETKMIRFLGMFYKAAVEHSVKLIEAGYSQEKIDSITALKEQLERADNEQEMAKKKRPLLTQDRVTTLNECYELMQQISKAAKIIFAKDRAKYDQYLLPTEHSGNNGGKPDVPPDQPTS